MTIHANTATIVSANPEMHAPGTGLTFTWDSAADIPMSAMGVVFRVDAYDGVTGTSCMQTYDVTNNTAPSCVVNMPAAASTGSPSMPPPP